MGIRATIPPGATPMAAVDAIMALYGRESVEIAIEALLERLDLLDGDPDEEDGEVGDGTWNAAGRYIGAKPPVPGDSEDSEPVGDEQDFAWIERQRQDRPGGREGFGEGFYGFAGNGEDREDDDAAEDDLQDMCEAGDDGCGAFLWGGMNGRLRAWGAAADEADLEEVLQPALTADAAANDA